MPIWLQSDERGLLSQCAMAILHMGVEKLTIFWREVTLGFYLPKIIKISSFLTKLFKKDMLHHFFETWCISPWDVRKVGSKWLKTLLTQPVN